MTYPSVGYYGYAPIEMEDSRDEPLGVRIAEVLLVFALLFFVTGLIGFVGIQNSSFKDAMPYSRLLDVSMGATTVCFTAIIVLLIVEHIRKQ